MYSDPTYEAWKRRLIVSLSPLYLYSDPTYEAWKPTRSILPSIFLPSFRSYLRGMETVLSF